MEHPGAVKKANPWRCATSIIASVAAAAPSSSPSMRRVIESRLLT